MRRLYLEAVLRQPVEFYDAPAASSQATTFRVISTISDDADTIQDFLAEKVFAHSLLVLTSYRRAVGTENHISMF
jgi:hypothetical protein